MLTAEGRLSILDLLHTFNGAIDSTDVERWLSIWTPYAGFQHPARPFRGLVELTQFITARNAGLSTHPLVEQRHWIADIEIRAESGGLAAASCRMLVSGRDRATGAPVVAVRGRFEDSLRKTPDGWRFARRILNFEYVRDITSSDADSGERG